MKSVIAGLTFTAALFGSSGVTAQMFPEALVRFDGGIGSQPLAGTPGAIVTNDVSRGGVTVQPGGRPWVIGDLRAVVRQDATIAVKGEGLLLAGTGNIGHPGLPRRVAATLFCGNDSFNSAAADVAANGDFVIPRSPLAGTNLLPAVCETPVLLIRNVSLTTGALGAWFAAGIPKLPGLPNNEGGLLP